MHDLLAEYEGAFFELLRELQELRSASVIATVAQGSPEKQYTTPPSFSRLEANVFDVVNDGENEPWHHQARNIEKLHQEEYESIRRLDEDSAHKRETSALASPTTDYASVQRAAAMSTPLPAPLAAAGLHRQGQVPQSAPLPGLPSSFPATAQQRRRGWLGWVFGGGERPPKKRVRNALV